MAVMSFGALVGNALLDEAISGLIRPSKGLIPVCHDRILTQTRTGMVEQDSHHRQTSYSDGRAGLPSDTSFDRRDGRPSFEKHIGS